jgi:chaperone modulatory protein CbpM
MRVQVTESVWLDDAGVCSVEQLAEISGLSIAEIDDLVENGLIAPTDRDVQPRSFQLHHITTARTARKLRDDFELDPHGVTLALTLLRRVEELQAELATAQARFRRAIQGKS